MVGRREEILDAAVAIADERGIEAVSMRAVAERVGVTPMALYSHVGDKTGLLDAMNGWVLAKLAKSPRSTDPWQRLFDFARASRRLTRRHPWAAQLLLSRPVNTAEASAASMRSGSRCWKSEFRRRTCPGSSGC